MTPLVSQRHLPEKQWPQFCFFFFSHSFSLFLFLGHGGRGVKHGVCRYTDGSVFARYMYEIVIASHLLDKTNPRRKYYRS